MKRILALAIMGVVVSVMLAACGSSKGGHCDAYGSAQQTENTDLASK